MGGLNGLGVASEGHGWPHMFADGLGVRKWPYEFTGCHGGSRVASGGHG
jgi:hypothetical protein